jgi:chaperone required for assembly of F1-ATPase
MTAGKDGNGDAMKPASGGPKGPITDSLAKPMAKRFYKSVSVGEGAFFQILLDGRVVKTPRKRALLLPASPLAHAVAAEWEAQVTNINPASMPLTRFANTAIDAVAEEPDAVAADIVAFAGSDLMCYRSADVASLAASQAAAWDPVLAWADSALGAKFKTGLGVMPLEQPRQALMRFSSALEPHEPFRLTGLHVLTTLTGSAILALAHERGFISAEKAWAAAHVDEDHQIALWGPDDEAAARTAHRKLEFDAASRMLAMLRPG